MLNAILKAISDSNLEGATPTRLGPRPFIRALGPSVTTICLVKNPHKIQNSKSHRAIKCLETIIFLLVRAKTRTPSD